MTTKYHFNQNTLNTILNDEDDMIQDLGQQTIDNFKKYTNTVLNFHDNVNRFKQEEPNAYRKLAQNLDIARRNEHNICLGDIDILNRVAKTIPDTEPFCDLNGAKSAKDVDRTEIGNTILIWAYENYQDVTKQDLEEYGFDTTNLVKNRENLDTITNERTLSPEDQLMNDYNAVLRDNRYPMIKKDEQYQFVHYLTQKKTTPEIAQQHYHEKLKEHHLLNQENLDLSEKAVSQVNESRKHYVSKPQMNELNHIHDTHLDLDI